MAAPGGQLARRVGVALVGIPVAVALAYLGGYWLAALLAVIAGLAAWEFGVMHRRSGVGAEPRVAALLALALVLSAALAPPGTFVVWATLLALVAGAALMLRTAPESGPGQTVMTTLFAAAYAGVPLGMALWLRFLTGKGSDWRGAAIFFLPIAATWLGDTAAYFGGKALGRHKFAPLISPAKTWEGAITGFLAATGGAWLFAALTAPLVRWTLGPLELVGLGAVLATAGQVGDLFESRFKRDCRVKDSSNLLPGHGGFLDRLDSLLFVFPTAYAYLRAVGI